MVSIVTIGLSEATIFRNVKVLISPRNIIRIITILHVSDRGSKTNCKMQFTELKLTKKKSK